jgi:hypothetical protein
VVLSRGLIKIRESAKVPWLVDPLEIDYQHKEDSKGKG